MKTISILTNTNARHPIYLCSSYTSLFKQSVGSLYILLAKIFKQKKLKLITPSSLRVKGNEITKFFRNGPKSGNLGPYPPNFFIDSESFDTQLTYIRIRKNYVENFQLGQTSLTKCDGLFLSL